MIPYVLLSLFYNVENSQTEENFEWVGLSKRLTGTVHYTAGQKFH
jgi:hypothetical protein